MPIIVRSLAFWLQDTMSPIVTTPNEVILATSKKPLRSLSVTDTPPVIAAPQVEPPLSLSKTVWPVPKLPVGSCWDELIVPAVDGFVLLKAISQY